MNETHPIEPFVCVGHSHVRCLAEAAARENTTLHSLDLWTVEAATPEDQAGRLAQWLGEYARGWPIVSVIGGNPHHKLGLVEHPRPFDFVWLETEKTGLDDRAEVVPLDGVRAAIEEEARAHLALLSVVRAVAGGPVYHLEPPPVSADERSLRRDVPALFFGGRTRIARPALRYKLWRLHSDIVSRFCAQADIIFVSCPSEVMGPGGFLRPEFYRDAMHVTETYGALLLRQIRALVAGAI